MTDAWIPVESEGDGEPERPRIQDILSGRVLDHSGSGLTEKDLTNTLAPLSGMTPDLFQSTMKAGQALGTAAGFGVERDRLETYPRPYATVALAAALALRKCGHEVKAMYDTDVGATIEAATSASLLTLGCPMQVDVIDWGAQAQIRAAVQVRGQLTDHGRSDRLLDQFFAAAGEYAGRLR